MSKLSKLNSENLNGLITINADSIIDTDQTSTNIYGTNLYINNQLINFGSYVTSSYFTSQLNNYVLSSYLSSQLSNYATISYVNSQLSNYATNGALSSYRLISDSYAKWEIDNMVGGLSAGIAANGVAITGVVVSLAATNATVAGLVGSVASLDGQVSTLNTKTMYQSTGTGLSGPYTAFTNNLNVSNGVSNAIQLKNTGEAIMDTLTTTYIQPNSTTISISGNNINIGGLTSVIYINGLPYSAFNQLNFLSQW